ncbi:hypothetical protein GCK32_000286 [Trichostrongylus colubriformis]|uniref:Uncharacterized protein n=1 Tax=Trichostrongylus colubriformis TaxID=6319 RepID=A0AAN8F792_TRICO
MCQIVSSTFNDESRNDRRLPFDAQPLPSSTTTVTVDSFADTETAHRRWRGDIDDASSAFRPYSCSTTSATTSAVVATSSISSSHRNQHFVTESQPLDLRKRGSSPPATQLKSSTTSLTPPPKPRKGNYFLIDSLLTPAHSSDQSLSFTRKGVERAPVFLGCSLATAFENPTATFDIPKRNRIEPNCDVAQAPAPAVLSPHRSNGQETLNSSSSMRKLKREPDDTTSATMAPPPNICVDDEVFLSFHHL